MTTLSILGAGSMAAAVATLAVRGGAQVQVLARDPQNAATVAAAAGPAVTSGRIGDALTGEVVVLALPYAALAGTAALYGPQLDGKTVVDLTNPVNFETFDGLAVAAGTSAAQELATLLPAAHVLKAFNTNFAATLVTGAVGSAVTTVLVAGDDAAAKSALLALVRAAGLAGIDAGALSRAQQLEALGFLQLTLAVGGTLPWTGGFTVAS